MKILHLNLKPDKDDCVELRIFWENPNDYVSRAFSKDEIDGLVNDF